MGRTFNCPWSTSAGGRRNGDITEIQGISARKIGQDQGRHVKKNPESQQFTQCRGLSETRLLLNLCQEKI